MITINALKIRTKLGGILDSVAQKGETYIVERMGKPMAVIVPYNQFDFEKVQKEQRRKRMEEAAKHMDELYKKYDRKYKGEDSAISVRRMRHERSKPLIDVVEGRQWI